MTKNLFGFPVSIRARKRSINIPLIMSRFVHIYKPLTGEFTGATVWLFLDRETALESVDEYAGGSSLGLEGD